MTVPKSIEASNLFFSSSSNLNSFADILKFSPSGFALVDRNYKIQNVNETFARWFGTASSELVGKSLLDIFPSLWLFMEPQC